MDWPTLVGGASAGMAGIAAAIWGAYRYVNRTGAADKAERFANDWHQKVIERQDKEADKLRVEIAALRDNGTVMNRRVLELELEAKVARKTTMELVDQVRLVKRDKMDPHDLDTNIFR